LIDLYPVVGPLLRCLDPERAHALTIAALKCHLVPRPPVPDDPILRQRVWGLEFPNPVGLAPGFDKHAEVPDAVLGLGVGFVEIGGVTPRPQPGNPRPRLFRLTEDGAVINRLGFNSEGLAVVQDRLAARQRRGIVGANLGKNKDSTDGADDFVQGAQALWRHVDYLVVNVSSPNTPGLRALQSKAQLAEIVQRVRAVLAPHPKAPPLLLKIAPDVTAEDRRDIADVALSGGIAGLIVANTTVARPASLKSPHRAEAGGLSGRPLFEMTTVMLKEMYGLTGGKLPLIGSGGIASGSDAYAKIRAGASLVQFYSALVFKGPHLIAEMCRDLAALLRKDGFKSVAEAVGVDQR
jgi:dihydroorotate dehydrogenase